jgi:arsenate reductase
MTVTIYHNPRCSKSRQTLELLRDHGQDPTIVEYLKTPPDAATLSTLVTKLDLQPLDIIRTGEEAFKSMREAVRAMNADEQLDWLASNPTALQRPIVVAGKQARIGRPPESVLEILPGA